MHTASTPVPITFLSAPELAIWRLCGRQLLAVQDTPESSVTQQKQVIRSAHGSFRRVQVPPLGCCYPEFSPEPANPIHLPVTPQYTALKPQFQPATSSTVTQSGQRGWVTPQCHPQGAGDLRLKCGHTVKDRQGRRSRHNQCTSMRKMLDMRITLPQRPLTTAARRSSSRNRELDATHTSPWGARA